MMRLSYQRGVGLVEVLVAVLLLSVAVLGFSALQMRAIKATEESLVRTQALSVVRGLAENMRANSSQLATYQTTINAVDLNTAIDTSCQQLTDNCTSEQIAIKEATNAAVILNNYDIEVKMQKCPSESGISEFSEIKCIIAAWDDTKPIMDDTDKLACASAGGVYKSGSTCVIVEAY